MFKKVIKLREKSLGEWHADTLVSIHNLAFVLQDLGKNEASKTEYRRAVIGREAVLGEDHPSTLSTIANLAEVFEAEAKISDALMLYTRVFEGRENCFGLTHPETVESVVNLERVYVVLELFQEASELYHKVIECYQSENGGLVETPPMSTTQQTSRGMVYRSHSKLRDSRIRNSSKNSQGSEISEIMDFTISHRSSMCTQKSMSPNQISSLRLAHEKKEQELGKFATETITSCWNFAVCLKAVERYEEALPYFRRVFEVHLKPRGDDNEEEQIPIPATHCPARTRFSLKDKRSSYQKT